MRTILRGVAKTNGHGTAYFKTIFPGCYDGRWPHIRFEVYSSVAKATSGGPIVKTSQLATVTGSVGKGYVANLTIAV